MRANNQTGRNSKIVNIFFSLSRKIIVKKGKNKEGVGMWDSDDFYIHLNPFVETTPIHIYTRAHFGFPECLYKARSGKECFILR